MKKEKNPDSLLIPLAGLSPGWFAFYCSGGKWNYAEHLALLDEILVKTAKRELRKVIINMPPRHGKSELISKYFPAWYLCNFPAHRIILTSYEARFAASWGRKVKDILNINGKEIYDIEINKKVNSAISFEISGSSGGLVCVGAGGAITGRGADLLIIDDPLKNDKEANSPVIRENIWEWFRATAYTRLEPDGVVIILMTRWHEDDLCGRIMSSEDFIVLDSVSSLKNLQNLNNEWLILKLPAIAEEADPLGRTAGEPLWGRRFPSKKLNEIKNTLGSYWFSALYQQSPSPAGGGIFRREDFKYYKNDNNYFLLIDSGKIIPEEKCKILSTVDLAISTSERADYTVILVIAAATGGEIMVLDILREKCEPAGHLKLLKSVYYKWKPSIIGIENVQYQLSLIQSALREGLPVAKLKADKDKLSRAIPLAARMNGGLVFFPERASWLDDLESELLSFPNGLHDDQVDALAYSLQFVMDKKGPDPVSSKTGFKRITDTF